MEVNISEQGQWERIVEVSVPYEKLVPKIDEAYSKYKKTIQLEGFRKGKVPVDLIKKVYGSKIEKEAAENAMADYLEEAIAEKNVKLYDISQIESFNYDRKTGLQFKAIIKIQPEVKVEKYKELEIEKEIYQITDDDIQDVIENLREQHATMTDIDGAAQQGNYIVADIQKTDSTGVPLVGQKYENRYFHLDSSEAEAVFVDQLLGVKPGDTRRITLPAPKTNPDQKEQQNEYYDISVKEVKEKILPALDDELAKDIGKYETLEQLKSAIRENLVRQAEVNTKQNLSNRIMDEVVKSNPIELPDYMVENFLNAFIENMKNERNDKVNKQDLRETYRADAIWNLKWLLINDKISELENIKVEDTEINDYIEDLAKLAGKDAVLVRSKYRDTKKREQVMHKIQERKIVDFLVSHAKITEKIVTYRDRQKAQELIVS